MSSEELRYSKTIRDLVSSGQVDLQGGIYNLETGKPACLYRLTCLGRAMVTLFMNFMKRLELRKEYTAYVPKAFVPFSMADGHASAICGSCGTAWYKYVGVRSGVQLDTLQAKWTSLDSTRSRTGSG